MVEEIISRLVYFICENRFYSTRVIHDKYQEEREKIFQEIEFAYSEKEIKQFRNQIESYDFIQIINDFHQEYEEH